MTAASASIAPDWGFFIPHTGSEYPVIRHLDLGKKPYHLLAVIVHSMIKLTNDESAFLSWLIERVGDLHCESDLMIALIIITAN